MAARKSAIDPEVLQRMKFIALCKFRAAGRLVMQNVGWMLEKSIRVERLSHGGKSSNILEAFKSLSLKKKILSMEDKFLLCQNTLWRTDEEKQYLYHVIGGYKCFRDYPKKVRRNLSAVSYFKYYGPGRVIIREGHTPNAMYFIISGQIEETQQTFDVLTQSWEKSPVGKLSQGDVFGHESLLHDLPRPKTLTSLTGVELLCVMKEDFKNVLQTTIQKQWDEFEDAMSQFTYFSTFSEIAIREGCMLAKMKYFNPKETIFGDGKGVPNFVYFILSGQCQIIETLFVRVTKIGSKTFHTMYTPKESLEKIVEKDKKTISDIPTDHSKTGTKKKSNSIPLSILSLRVSEGPLKSLDTSKKSMISMKSSTADFRESSTVKCFENLPNNVKLFFMQVCLLNAGGCFGLGETMKNRRIVAVGEVKCLLLPVHWLWKWNPANIWSRIKHFMDRKIPSTEKVFHEFQLNYKWNEYKESIIKDILKHKKAVNFTSVHDVPYSIRIEQNFDFEHCNI